MQGDWESKYIELASTISFFEFLEEEFKESTFNVEEYKDEIEILESKTNWSQDELAESLQKHPKMFKIFEAIFQLKKFTNTQLIHFLFDITILNNTDTDIIIDYLMENLEYDSTFKDIFFDKYSKIFGGSISIDQISDLDSTIAIYLFKLSIIDYLNTVQKKPETLFSRIQNENFYEVPLRISDYVINNLHLNDVLSSINLSIYLEKKRIPRDTKGIHGNFGKVKVSEILNDHGFENVDSILKDKNLSLDLSSNKDLESYAGRRLYVTERTVDNIVKVKTNRKKKFDFIIIEDLKVKVVIETNFYSTAGSKIGINEEEYIDLYNEIKKINGLTFLWISDGNYWLSDGKTRFQNLYQKFGDNFMNYNMFRRWLDENF